jgi:hypothetical protein
VAKQASGGKTKYGFGAKKLFFSAIKAHFSRPENLERMLTVFTGAACEQWINCECFMALRGHLPNAWILPEWSKRDLALFASNEDEFPALLIETKVIYASYYHSNQSSKLRQLARQLKTCKKLAGKGAARNSVVGLVVSFDWTTTTNGITTKPRKDVLKSERMPRYLLTECGLVNAFGHTGGKKFRGLIKNPNGHVDVVVRFEMVRLAQ